MLLFLKSILGDQPGTGVIDLCLDHKLIAEISPEKFTAIEGLELFPDLEAFSASMQEIRFTGGLRAVPRLRELDLSMNAISDFPPVQFLPLLRRLNLSHNEIESLRGVPFPMSLRELDLGFNQISGLQGLEELEHLEILTLSGNRGLRQLKGLPPHLTTLHLQQCFLEDCQPLAGLERLTTLSLSPGQSAQLEPLSSIPHLASLLLHAGRIHGTLHVPPLPTVRKLHIHRAQQVTAVEGLDQMPDLEWLSIRHSLLERPPKLPADTALSVLEITFSPLQRLDGLAMLPGLKRLVLTGTAVPPQDIERLRLERPDVSVEH